MLGKEYTPREWVFCHYYPGKSEFPNRRFVHNKDWKLYEYGEVCHILNDHLEERTIPL